METSPIRLFHFPRRDLGRVREVEVFGLRAVSHVPAIFDAIVAICPFNTIRRAASPVETGRELSVVL